MIFPKIWGQSALGTVPFVDFKSSPYVLVMSIFAKRDKENRGHDRLYFVSPDF